MARARKFDTFSGVFTPSILTILGVIMYLRLPAIVGQAGLAATLAIILVAHVISVSTGLSVASVATDRKVRAGGTYFMLSRSLGLPIGGTLGIALFVGLSFAVSLYIIGFAESFLRFWDIEATKNAIRLTGLAVLVVLTVVTLISTSLALRTQFFILAAVTLSLLSILLGAGRHDLGAAALDGTAVDPVVTTAPLIVLFGIFFPAVTGFEAGVSMSGDLRNPKRSIPTGTIAAIAVGLAVYVGLAWFLGATVDATQLATNPRVLLDIALLPSLVIAGVWGATVSSALGSILAAPRILQATSGDRITPAIFARGYGPDNEPRQALILTCAIAGVGIMIGELNAIARIVSMFFITAYGFLNLACAIESWASPDFRPAFKVPRLVPLVGTLACLIVMIQLDLLAMIGATLVLGALYLYLARRQLRLESGDAWSGFWGVVARAALHRLDRSVAHRRNWRPNLIAFALPGAAQEALFGMGRELAGRRGMLTAVEVVPATAGRGAVVRRANTADNGEDTYGVFARDLECSDAYASVAEMARYHGFAGLEPNALLLPWPAEPDPGFAELLDSLASLDQNVLLLAPTDQPPDQEPRVDVWWSGEPNGAGLQLSLLRALLSNDAWRRARVRVLTAAPAHGAPDTAGRHMAALLADMRIDADVEVVRDVAPAHRLEELIAAHSGDADLVLIDATPFTVRPRILDVQRADALRSKLRATLFALPSSVFAQDRARAARIRPRPPAATARAVDFTAHDRKLRLPADTTLAEAVTRLYAALDEVAEDSIGPLAEACAQNAALVERASTLADEALAAISAAGERAPRAERALRKIHGDLLFHSVQLLVQHRQRSLPGQAEDLAEFVDRSLRALAVVADGFEPTIAVTRERASFLRAEGDDVRLRLYKFVRRTVSFRRPGVRATVPLRALVRRHIDDAIPVVERVSREFVANAAAALTETQALLAQAHTALARAAAANGGSAGMHERVQAERAALRDLAGAALARYESEPARVRHDVRLRARLLARRVARDLERVDAARRARISATARRTAEARITAARELAAGWQDGQALLLAGAELELTLLALRNRIGTLVQRARDALLQDIRNGMQARMQAVREALLTYIERAARDPDTQFTRLFERWPGFDPQQFIDELKLELRAATTDLPERVETLSPSATARLVSGRIDDLEVVSVALRPLVEYYLDTEFLGPLQGRLSRVPAVYATATDTARDAVRLAAFRLPAADADGDRAGPRLMLEGALRRIDAALGEIEALAAVTDADVAAQLDHALPSLSQYRLLRESDRLPHYIRARHGHEALSWFREQKQRVQRYAAEQAVRLIYKRSEAVRLARELESRARTDRNRLLELVTTASADMRVLERLPYHYRQLFLGAPDFTRDLWSGWAVERRLAARAIAHYRGGFPGPLLVLGEPLAGKSALARAIAQEHFDDTRVYRVLPPPDRATSAEALLSGIAEAVGVPAGSADPLLTLPEESAVVFEDLELWWERDDDGYGALDAAFELMERHAGRCLFVVSADIHAFRFIDRVRALRNRFLDVIECRPFSAREIAEVIELRHGSTGLTFEIDGVSEDRLTGLARARLFHRLFDYSAGNIGAALHAWVAHISAVDGDRLTLERPVVPDLQPLAELEPLQKLLLVQLVLHRVLPAERLLRLGGANPAWLTAPLSQLRSMHVVLEDPRRGVHINPFLRPFVARQLTQLGFIE